MDFGDAAYQKCKKIKKKKVIIDGLGRGGGTFCEEPRARSPQIERSLSWAMVMCRQSFVPYSIAQKASPIIFQSSPIV